MPTEQSRSSDPSARPDGQGALQRIAQPASVRPVVPRTTPGQTRLQDAEDGGSAVEAHPS